MAKYSNPYSKLQCRRTAFLIICFTISVFVLVSVSTISMTSLQNLYFHSKFDNLQSAGKSLFNKSETISNSGRRNSVNEDKNIQETNNATSSLISPGKSITIPSFSPPGYFQCSRIFSGDAREIRRAQFYRKGIVQSSSVRDMAKNCSSFISTRKYIMDSVTAEERDFPIAFSILMYKEVDHFERLLRAIYRPQNVYCVHMDKKAHARDRQALHEIIKCFPNVFHASQTIEVVWGGYSVLEAELVCMKDLLRKDTKWRYFINLTGQEFPLKTNWDLVRILKALNGSNNMEGSIMRRHNSRYRSASKLPVPVTLTKGSVHIVAVRDFVTFALNDKKAQLFLNWVKETHIPDETFFTSLNFSPQLGVPGSYNGYPETDAGANMFIARFKNWKQWPQRFPCSGKFVRTICIFGVGDLRPLSQRPELFANKFYAHYQSAALDCMEELHYNRTRDEYLGLRSFNTSFYSNLASVKNHL